MRGQGIAGHRVAPEQQLVDGVVGEMLGVVAVGMTASDAEDPLAEQIRHRVPALAGFAPVEQRLVEQVREEDSL